MEDKILLSLVWLLAKGKDQLLSELIPTAQEMSNCLREGRDPAPEVGQKWRELEQQINGEAHDLSEFISTVQRAAQTAPRSFDA